MFLDANVLVYAYLSAKRGLDKRSLEIKDQAKRIVRRVDEGEQVATSLVHVSEVANVLEMGMTNERLCQLLRSIIGKENILITEPTNADYLLGIELACELGIGPNDGLALAIMRRIGIHSIYSFDSHFDGIEGIERLEC